MPSEPAPLGAIQELTLANGLRVVYAPMPWLPTLSAALSLPFGSATDPEGREGSANVLHEWLQRGAGAMGSREYSDALLDLGARRGGGSGREAIGGGGRRGHAEGQRGLRCRYGHVQEARWRRWR